MEGVTPGRIVHYCAAGEHWAAVITRVWDDQGKVNLHVFRDGSSPFVPETPTFVSFDANKGDGSWHWIEKA
jgi:hypothetical protein